MTNTPIQKKRLFYLDFIRVVCTLLIVIYHFPLSWNGAVDWLHSTQNGRWGVAVVYVFFMISGAAAFYTSGHGAFSSWQYLKKRWFALYPLFYLAYIGGFMTVFWIQGRTYDYIPSYSIIWSILGIDGYLNNIVPTFTMVGEWFLGAILMVYLCFPLLRFLCRKYGIKKILLLSLLPALFFFCYGTAGRIEVKQNLFVDLFFFLLGGYIGENAVSLASENNVNAPGTDHFRRISGTVSFLYLCLWFFVSFPGADTLLGSASLFPVWSSNLYINLIDAFGALALYLFFLSVSGIFERFEGIRSAVFYFSRYTYGIFLVHHLTIALICSHFVTDNFGNRNTLVLLVLCLIAVWIATAVLYGVHRYLKDIFCPDHHVR